VPSSPKLQQITVADGQTYLTTVLFTQFQNNVAAYGAQFLPLIGGSLTGIIGWAAAQTFPAAGVTVTNPSYKHQGYWKTLADHIADSTVHAVVGPPLSHASSHEIGGTDLLTGDQLQITLKPGSGSIKSYVDTTVARATAGVSNNFAPSSRYAIGGADPLYGTTIAIASTASSISIKSYIDSSISGAIVGGYPTSPTFTTISLSGTAATIAFTAGPLLLSSQGNILLLSDANNLNIKSPTSNGAINFGNGTTATLYGSLSRSGYTIGATVIGPSGSVIDGPLTVNSTLLLNASDSSLPGAATINWGGPGAGVLSYNADVANSFYFNENLSIAGSIGIAAGSDISINNTWTISTRSSVVANPGIKSDGVNVNLNAKNGGTIGIGSDMSSLAAINFGPSAAWATISALGLQMGSSTYSATAASIAGLVAVNGGFAASAGDFGLARNGNSAIIYWGQGATAAFQDYGLTSNGYFTFGTRATGTLSQIKSDGSYLTGSSSYGPQAATVNGTITAEKAIYAQTGIAFAGVDGFVFTGDTAGSTGMFSIGPGDLRLYTVGTQALAFTNNGTLATFIGAVGVGTALTTNSLTVSAGATVGNLTINGTLNGGSTTISKFRVKSSMDLGYIAGTSSTGNVYPNRVVPGYTGGQIEVIRLSAVTADSTSTATTFNITKNGQVIGTVSLPNGSKTAQAFPITNPTPITAGDQIQAVCTVAGTSVGVSVSLELSQFVY
jgi:hypothetical protein